MSALDFLGERLGALRASGLYREPDDGKGRKRAAEAAVAGGVEFVDACSNDYLGYAHQPPDPADVSRETKFSGSDSPADTGAGASRLVHGTRPQHTELESHLADWVRFERTLLFSSGYCANVGVLSALVQADDTIISDALNHASIIDGCRLTRAQTLVAPHRDTAAVERLLEKHAPATRCWVVTETYFSMDGDSPDLPALRALCDRHGAALIVDEAHALGVFGPQGSGLCRLHNVKPDVLVGTFGKALGAQGAFAATSSLARDWLWNRARSFVYSTAVSPMLAAAIQVNLWRVQRDDRSREVLHGHAEWFRNMLAAHGVPVLRDSVGPIVPILCRTPARALDAAAALAQLGILAQAIRPPTVPEGTSRIRLTLNASMTRAQLERLGRAVIASCAP